MTIFFVSGGLIQTARVGPTRMFSISRWGQYVLTMPMHAGVYTHETHNVHTFLAVSGFCGNDGRRNSTRRS